MTLIRFLILLIVTIGTVAAIFVFGNPQWSRWIYVFQGYHMREPQFESHLERYFGPVPITEGYTGKWCSYRFDGSLYGFWNIDRPYEGSYPSYNEEALFSGGDVTTHNIFRNTDDEYPMQEWMLHAEYDGDILKRITFSGSVPLEPSDIVYDADLGVDRRSWFDIPATREFLYPQLGIARMKTQGDREVTALLVLAALPFLVLTQWIRKLNVRWLPFRYYRIACWTYVCAVLVVRGDMI